MTLKLVHEEQAMSSCTIIASTRINARFLGVRIVSEIGER